MPELVGYLHCKKCIEEKLIPDIEAGVTEEGELVINCRNHDLLVAKFELKDPPLMRCDTCGLPLGNGHKH